MHAATCLAGHGGRAEKMTGKRRRRPTLFLYEHAWARPLRPRLRALPHLPCRGRLAHGNAPRLLRQRQRDPRHRGPDAQPRRAIRELVDQVFDYQEAAELVLGPVWQMRTPEQRTEFVRLFADFLERGFVAMIGSKASVSSGVNVQYVGESIDGQSAVVSTTVLTRSGGEMPVDYSMVQGQGRWLVRDVIIEGVSLIANYRAQFARVIRASSYAALIAKMRGDTDEAPRERRWVVTVETTPVAPTPVVPHLASSTLVAPPPVAAAPPPVAVAAPPVTPLS